MCPSPIDSLKASVANYLDISGRLSVGENEAARRREDGGESESGKEFNVRSSLEANEAAWIK